MTTRPYSQLKDSQLADLYHCFCIVARSDSIDGFLHNRDPGHPVYMAGAERSETGSFGYADGPDRNPLFQLGAGVHEECAARSPNFFERHADPRDGAPYSSWEAFCDTVRERHRRKFGSAGA